MPADTISIRVGRSIVVGTIFDPRSTAAYTCNTAAFPGSDCVNGTQGVIRNPFPLNAVPANLFDPISLRIKNLFPNPTGPNALAISQAGLELSGPAGRATGPRRVPSMKIDHQISSKARTCRSYGAAPSWKLSFSAPQ